jgi:hypothetical protein
MTYFNHQYASNSDLKTIVDRHEGRQKPDNIGLIYDFGTEFHSGILEPQKNDWSKVTAEQKLLIQEMSKTFWRDKLCQQIAMMPDFRREHEFYRINRFGLAGVRCKCDGESARLRCILELKGLSVTTEKAFKESVMHLHYDQGSAFYIETATGHVRYDTKLIVGISKINPDMMFKMLIDRQHPYYRTGYQKISKAVRIWKTFGLN